MRDIGESGFAESVAVIKCSVYLLLLLLLFRIITL